MTIPNYLVIRVLENVLTLSDTLEYLLCFLEKFTLVSKQWNEQVIPKLHYKTYIILPNRKVPNISRVSRLIQTHSDLTFSLPFNISIKNQFDQNLLDIVSHRIVDIFSWGIPEKETLDYFPNLTKCKISLTEQDVYTLSDQYKSIVFSIHGHAVHSNFNLVKNQICLNGIKRLACTSNSLEQFILQNPTPTPLKITSLSISNIRMRVNPLYLLLENLTNTIKLDLCSIQFVDYFSPFFDTILNKIISLSNLTSSLKSMILNFPDFKILPTTIERVLPMLVHLDSLILDFEPNIKEDVIVQPQCLKNSFVYSFKQQQRPTENESGSILSKFRRIIITSSIVPRSDQDLMNSKAINNLEKLIVFSSANNQQSKVNYANVIIQRNLPSLKDIKFYQPTDEYPNYDNSKLFQFGDYLESLMKNQCLKSIEFGVATIQTVNQFLQSNHPSITSLTIEILDINEDDKEIVEDMVKLLHQHKTLKHFYINECTTFESPFQPKHFIDILKFNHSLVALSLPRLSDTSDIDKSILIDLENAIKSNHSITNIGNIGQDLSLPFLKSLYNAQ
ncbi:hypothetical protein DLAC_05833 [Tieghemostelium lacteum]|uniref:SAM-dependent MTase TRM10-type domain-containing protein n=1 Tax=Tieghemostelium lacteum TaxID=361077 RepID=A0A151ZGZ0_TIELA|nr:hypothetical protein DLAC_05833 [Tieghemostelium lacteum]|eukprot:KYQ93195.1 hypothetical protein DLAC_05833 [Tieghemostelium lacteum]